jgi:hypothetical protein
MTSAFRNHIRDIFQLGADREMIYVYATSVVAVVEKYHSGWNWSFLNYSRHPVGGRFFAIYADYTVSVMADAAGPNCAS